MITTSYDPGADALTVWLASPETIPARTEEVAPGVMLDFDAEGQLVGIEVLYLRLCHIAASHAAEREVARPAAE